MASPNTAKNIRVGVLLLVLLAVGAWGVRKRQAVGMRKGWVAPLPVAVVLVSKQPAPAATVEAWKKGLAALEEFGESEIGRYRGATHFPPLAFRLATPVVGEPPPLPGAEVSVTDRAAAALAFEQAARALDAQAGITADDAVVIDVLLGDGEGGSVEGIAEKEGRRGVVQAGLQETELGLELVATFHEVLHTVGATDKYDAAGHATVPQGLADPDQSPRFPQQLGEVMVGEVPLGESSGRPIRGLTEAAVGPYTAQEIGWTR